jgi:hypothetical protein
LEVWEVRRGPYNGIMSFIAKGDFKTREEWLKKQKRAALKK